LGEHPKGKEALPGNAIWRSRRSLGPSGTPIIGGKGTNATVGKSQIEKCRDQGGNHVAGMYTEKREST